MPAIHIAQKLAEKAQSNIFLYYYTYAGSLNMCDLVNLDLMKFSLTLGAHALGLDYSWLQKNVSCHGDETLLIFKSYDIPIDTHYSESDKKVAGMLLELWTNFVKDGKDWIQAMHKDLNLAKMLKWK